MSFKINQEIACCGGKFLKLSHQSSETKTAMDVNFYLPKQYYEVDSTLIPVIYYLSGLTCSPQNATEKAFWQVQADKYGFAIVFPDTSPRGDKVPGDPEKGWDFGLAAGFYVDATQEPYKTNYRMFSYIHEELPKELDSYFNKENTKIDFLDNVAITGHSMGGFGALSGYLKYYTRYKSCSAFAPIANPTNVPWGIKALNGYLGPDKELWAQYDPCSLVSEVDNTRQSTILIHCGTKDPFLNDQLKPQQLLEAVKNTSWEGKINLKIVEGFDHSYFFISTFVPEHAEFHAKNLGLI